MFNNTGQVIHKNQEKEWPQNGTLRHTCSYTSPFRASATDNNSMPPSFQVVFKLNVFLVSDSKSFKFLQKKLKGMVNRIKSHRQINHYRTNNHTIIESRFQSSVHFNKTSWVQWFDRKPDWATYIQEFV